MAKRTKESNKGEAPEPTSRDGEDHNSAASADFQSPEQERQAAASRALVADPVGMQMIALSDENDGPKMRLMRSNKYQQIQIQFDEKPSEEVRARLHAEGWKWRNVEKIWTKQLDPEGRWRTHADAEKLFVEIGNVIRAEKGLSQVIDNAR